MEISRPRGGLVYFRAIHACLVYTAMENRDKPFSVALAVGAASKKFPHRIGLLCASNVLLHLCVFAPIGPKETSMDKSNVDRNAAVQLIAVLLRDHLPSGAITDAINKLPLGKLILNEVGEKRYQLAKALFAEACSAVRDE